MGVSTSSLYKEASCLSRPNRQPSVNILDFDPLSQPLPWAEFESQGYPQHFRMPCTNSDSDSDSNFKNDNFNLVRDSCQVGELEDQTLREPKTWENEETDMYERCANCGSGMSRGRGREREYYVAGRTTSYYEILCRAQGLPIRDMYWRGGNIMGYGRYGQLGLRF